MQENKTLSNINNALKEIQLYVNVYSALALVIKYYFKWKLVRVGDEVYVSNEQTKEIYLVKRVK